MCEEIDRDRQCSEDDGSRFFTGLFVTSTFGAGFYGLLYWAIFS